MDDLNHFSVRHKRLFGSGQCKQRDEQPNIRAPGGDWRSLLGAFGRFKSLYWRF
jgi:hypothetical protein